MYETLTTYMGIWT